jgi:hypothetical protein
MAHFNVAAEGFLDIPPAEKSLSPSGKVQMQCICSGRITQALMVKGFERFTMEVAARRLSI